MATKFRATEDCKCKYDVDYESYSAVGSTAAEATQRLRDHEAYVCGGLDSDVGARKNLEVTSFTGPDAPPVPVSPYTLHAGTVLEETDDSWSFDFAENLDLFAFKRIQQDDAYEVHVMPLEGNYQSFIVHAPTPFKFAHDAQLLVARNRDVIAVKKQGGNDKTEVHILNHETSYGTFNGQYVTGLHATDDTWSFALDRNNSDLFALKRLPDGTHELHALSALSKYKEFVLHTTIPISGAVVTSFSIASGSRRFYGILQKGTGSHHTELHGLNAGPYQDFFLNFATVLPETDANFSFSVPNDYAGHVPSLALVKKSGTGTHKTEVHLLRIP